ncbi:MAG: IPT/TIG domain-containing protein, partial [Thermoanaerobaculia bacterium]|nr:IPT/TIG domain-containing protein [Thermoanaerobaculia bacterium]
TLSLQPAQVSIPAGGTGTTTVQITRTGALGAVGLAVVGLPPGVLASVAPNPVTGSPATLTLTVGANVPAGTTPFQVTGSAPGGVVTPAGGNLTVTAAPAQAPRIDSFSPTSGIAGTSVILTGVNLNGTFDVSFGTQAFGFDSIGFTPMSATRVDVLIPAGKPSGFFRLTTPAGTTTSAMAFQVTTPNLPEIGGFDPLSGPPGRRVEIVGTNLGTATGVSFNGTPANFEPPQANRIFATVPAGATTGQIRVTTPTGTATSFASFAVTNGGAVITGFQPPAGRPGDSVTLAGVNLTGAFAVTINRIPGDVGIVTANFVQVFVPSGATTGRIELSTPAGPAMTATDFIVLP